ncbi:hypothetical protein VTH06DRAFT_7333 [Thermothelomyces fergusii]
MAVTASGLDEKGPGKVWHFSLFFYYGHFHFFPALFLSFLLFSRFGKASWNWAKERKVKQLHTVLECL